jgi:hypothetical protein
MDSAQIECHLDLQDNVDWRAVPGCGPEAPLFESIDGILIQTQA